MMPHARSHARACDARVTAAAMRSAVVCSLLAWRALNLIFTVHLCAGLLLSKQTLAHGDMGMVGVAACSALWHMPAWWTLAVQGSNWFKV